MTISRSAVLRTLTKARLLKIANAIESTAKPRDYKEDIVQALAHSSLKTREFLKPLSRVELKRCCKRLGLPDRGRKKRTLQTRILRKTDSKTLKRQIRKALSEQGFSVHRNRIDLPKKLDKAKYREIHALAVEHRVEKARRGLERFEGRLIERIANGSEVSPSAVSPQLIPVKSDSEDELLFRYASLHWSIPVSSGYGRRLRFIVVDESNGKLIGIIGLGDPVFSLRARDSWIGWNTSQRRERLQNVMDAFVLGAVPPYSSLLCGKLVALLATSTEVRDAFKRKYDRRESVIRGEELSARLALITTTSALGRSSIYNRLRDGTHLAFESVGFTQGSGEFQFFNGVYDKMTDFAIDRLEPTAKHDDWGTGFRNRREVVRKCLAELGLAADWLYHGIQREIFVAPLARNSREFLRGEHSRLLWHGSSADELFNGFRERWLLPRAQRDQRFREFDRNTYRIWAHGD